MKKSANPVQRLMYGLVMLSLAITGCGQTQTIPANEGGDKNLDSSGVVLKGLGSVVDVISGQRDNAIAPIELSEFAAGFEAGSPRDVESVGEFISFNGIGYTRSTSPLDRGQLLQGNRVFTNGAVFLPKGAEPALTVELTPDVSLLEWCTRMVNQAGRPICFSGVVEFNTLEATAITAPPVNSEPLFENREKYYAEGNWQKKNVRVAVFGCAADFALESEQMIEQLGVVLYQNPNDASGSLIIHTHGLELKSMPEELSQLKPADAVNVHHVFNHSIIKRGSLDVFVIDRVDRLH